MVPGGADCPDHDVYIHHGQIGPRLNHVLQSTYSAATRNDAEGLLAPWRDRLIAEARRLGDDAILDGDRLAQAPLDRRSFKDLPVTGMGWRWY